LKKRKKKKTSFFNKFSINRRTAVSLYIEVHEARNIAMGDVYIESRMDEVHLSSTSVRFKTQTPYWGENFTFE